MNKEDVRARILEIGIVPVVRAGSPREALLASEAVCEGGIAIVCVCVIGEISFFIDTDIEIIQCADELAAVFLQNQGREDIALETRLPDAQERFEVRLGLL